MSDYQGAIALAPGEGASIPGPAGGTLTFKLRGEHTAGTLTIVENVIAPGDGPPIHTHAREDESWYVLEGTLRFRLGDEERPAPQGSVVFVPRGVPHAFQNIGAEPARLLVIFTPSGMERFFDQFGALPPGTASPESFRTIGEQVGMDVIGPPLRE